MNRPRADIAVRSLLWLVVLALLVYLRKPPEAGLLHVRSGLASIVSVVLAVLGAALYLWAARTIASVVPAAGAAPVALLTSGPYRHVRHPIYLAAAVMFVGISTHYAPWGMSDLLLFGLVALFVHLAVAYLEEPATRRRLGPSYDEYCAQVPRWVPRRSPT